MNTGGGLIPAWSNTLGSQRLVPGNLDRLLSAATQATNTDAWRVLDLVDAAKRDPILASQIFTPAEIQTQEIRDQQEQRSRILLHERTFPIPLDIKPSLISTTPFEIRDSYDFLASPGDIVFIESLMSEEERFERWNFVKVTHQDTGASWYMPRHIFNIYVDDDQIIDWEVVH